jgi:quercetin dioxygenase-like cupin family protein
MDPSRATVPPGASPAASRAAEAATRSTPYRDDARDMRRRQEAAMAGYGYVQDLRNEVQVPKGGILSRTLYEDERLALTIFAFDSGQELTEHTSARAAVIEVLEGEAEIVLDGEPQAAHAGTWIAMPPGMRHAIRATSPLVMILTLLKPPA